jgi:tetrapyrrole methylase family protein/MazG family protein
MSGTQADITIVGLGPGDPARRTAEAQRLLDSAVRIYVRGHEGIDIGDLLGRDNVTDIDALCDSSAGLGHRWDAAVPVVCDAASREPVLLAIPGHPRFGEGLVLATMEDAARRSLTTRVVDGISVVDLVATALGVDPIVQGVQLFNARTVAPINAEHPYAGGLFTGSPRRPMLFTHVYDTGQCAALQGILGRLYPPEHQVIRIESAGMPDERISEHMIGDMAAMQGGSLVALWVPALSDLEAGADPRTMQHIVARLRRPDGCPWDRKQTNLSLRDALINEVYEAVDAIDSGDMDHLAEELGDLYLLILMHAQIAHEAGAFSIEDVYKGIATKIVGRHPHVFGDDFAGDAEDVVGIWAEVKAREKAAKGDSGGKDADGEPFSMPALTRATRILKNHPVAEDDNTPELLKIVAAIIADGDDPDTILRQQLREHVANHS